MNDHHITLQTPVVNSSVPLAPSANAALALRMSATLAGAVKKEYVPTDMACTLWPPPQDRPCSHHTVPKHAILAHECHTRHQQPDILHSTEGRIHILQITSSMWASQVSRTHSSEMPCKTIPRLQHKGCPEINIQLNSGQTLEIPPSLPNGLQISPPSLRYNSCNRTLDGKHHDT